MKWNRGNRAELQQTDSQLFLSLSNSESTSVYNTVVLLYCYKLQRRSLTTWPVSLCIQCIPYKQQEKEFEECRTFCELLTRSFDNS